METVRFPRGTTIFEEGEPGDHLYTITAGKIELARHAPDGRENLLTIIGPSDVFCAVSIFHPGPPTQSALCVAAVQAATVNSEVLKQWVPDHPAPAQPLPRVLARRLRRTKASLADLSCSDVPGRVAKTLLQLANRFGVQEGGSLRVNHDLTQKEIAQLVGASRETVNKALATFAHRGWIRLEGKSVVIVNTEHLAKRAR